MKWLAKALSKVYITQANGIKQDRSQLRIAHAYSLLSVAYLTGDVCDNYICDHLSIKQPSSHFQICHFRGS